MKIDVELWSAPNEWVVTVEGFPIGGAGTKDEIEKLARWLDCYLKDILKAIELAKEGKKFELS